jgi:hypothetical protein
LNLLKKAAKLRLMTALSLLRTPAVAARITNTQALQEQMLDLLHVFGKLGAAFPFLLDLRKELAVLQTLIAARGQTASDLLEAPLTESIARSDQLLSQIQTALGSAGYPFEHPKGRVTVIEYARAKQYDNDPARMVQLEVLSHLQMLFALYYRVLGRLTAIAVQVEEQYV